MCFNAIRENKILAKISEFTVLLMGDTRAHFDNPLGTFQEHTPIGKDDRNPATKIM